MEKSLTQKGIERFIRNIEQELSDVDSIKITLNKEDYNEIKRVFPRIEEPLKEKRYIVKIVRNCRKEGSDLNILNYEMIVSKNN